MDTYAAPKEIFQQTKKKQKSVQGVQPQLK